MSEAVIGFYNPFSSQDSLIPFVPPRVDLSSSHVIYDVIEKEVKADCLDDRIVINQIILNSPSFRIEKNIAPC